MKLELKSLKISHSLSEETLAFTATLWIDGVAAYAVSNHGTGGCNCYRQLTKDAPPITKIEAALVESGDAKADDFEILDGHLAEMIDKIDAEKRLDRMLKNKIVILGWAKGLPALFTYPAKIKPTPANLDQAAKRLKGGEIILNGRADLRDQALALV